MIILFSVLQDKSTLKCVNRLSCRLKMPKKRKSLLTANPELRHSNNSIGTSGNRIALEK